MAVFFTFPKGGITLIRDACFEYCGDHNLNYLNSADGFGKDYYKADCLQVEGDIQYFFLPEIDKGVAVLRDPRDMLVSAKYYYTNLPDHEKLDYYSEKHPDLTVKQCIEKRLDDYRFWALQFQYHFSEMYTLLLSADEKILLVRFENLCDADTYSQTWKKIADWLDWPTFDYYGMINSPCYEHFQPNDHVRSAKPEQYKTEIPKEDLYWINARIKSLINLMDQRCPIVK